MHEQRLGQEGPESERHRAIRTADPGGGRCNIVEVPANLAHQQARHIQVIHVVAGPNRTATKRAMRERD
jgi:hypothetical protein